MVVRNFEDSGLKKYQVDEIVLVVGYNLHMVQLGKQASSVVRASRAVATGCDAADFGQ